MARVHILRGRNYTSCTFIGGEIHRGDAYIKREKKFFYEKTLFYLFYIMYVFLFFFMMLWVTFSIYSLFLSSHHVYVLDMLSSLYYCAFLLACLDNHLLCYVIIVVISIWLSCVWSSYSYVSHRVYLVVFYLFIVVLYYLLYLEGLICFVQVFQNTSILFQVCHRF